MSPYYVTLKVAPYLAQWYAYKCWEHNYMLTDVAPSWPIKPMDVTNPVPVIKNSYESKLLERLLTRQPGPVPEKVPEDDNLCIGIPYYKNCDPRIFNYLGKHGKELLCISIRDAFQMDLWETLSDLGLKGERLDEAIWCFMENYYIDDTETNFNAIIKCYQRMRNYRNVKKCRKNKTTSRPDFSDM